MRHRPLESNSSIKDIFYEDDPNKCNGEYEEEDVINLFCIDLLIGCLLSSGSISDTLADNRKQKEEGRRERRKRRGGRGSKRAEGEVEEEEFSLCLLLLK